MLVKVGLKICTQDAREGGMRNEGPTSRSAIESLFAFATPNQASSRY